MWLLSWLWLLSLLWRSEIRSIIEIIHWDLDYILWSKVLLNERLTWIFFLVLVHVEDLLYPCLLYYLGAWKTGEVCRVETTSRRLADPHFNQGRLLGMQAKALIQLFSNVVITSLASHSIARGQTFGSAVVACRNYSVLAVDDDCSYWCFHAVWPSSGDICDFHEVLIPGGSKEPDDLFLFVSNLFLEIFKISPMPDSNSCELQTGLILRILELLIDFHELIDDFLTIFQRIALEIVMISYSERCIYNNHIHIVSFLELTQSTWMTLIDG